MTLEEKANAYDEAIKRAKNVFNNCYHEETKTACIEIFSELNKSKDERMSKYIIRVVNQWWDRLGDPSPDYPTRNEMLAYLETLKEQKSVEWNEEDDAAHTRILGAVAKAFMGVLPTKPSEEDVHWLKSLPERFNLQPKQEWSEEDEKKIERLRSIVNDCAFHYDALDVNGDYCESDYAELDDWLLSLRPFWKPSKEQMYILNWVANILLSHDNIVEQEAAKKLQSLYNDLKEL